MVEGFVLAASLHGDRLGERSLGAVRPHEGAIVRSALERLDSLAPEARRQLLRRIVAPLRRAPAADADLPARARAILASDVDRRTGEKWLSNAPAPRRGFRPDRGLRRLLRHLAVSPSLDDPQVREKEMEVGIAIAARTIPSLSQRERTAFLKSVGQVAATEVLKAADLRPHEHVSTEAVDIILFSLVAGMATKIMGTDRLRLLGALRLGYEGDPFGDANSTAWRRAGREMRELG